MNRRDLIKGLVATAAGILVPSAVAAEPERRIWALDRSMVTREPSRVFWHDDRIHGFIDKSWVGLTNDSFASFVSLTFKDGRRETIKMPFGQHRGEFTVEHEGVLTDVQVFSPTVGAMSSVFHRSK